MCRGQGQNRNVSGIVIAEQRFAVDNSIVQRQELCVGQRRQAALKTL